MLWRCGSQRWLLAAILAWERNSHVGEEIEP
jgi:hypothetical protein